MRLLFAPQLHEHCESSRVTVLWNVLLITATDAGNALNHGQKPRHLSDVASPLLAPSHNAELKTEVFSNLTAHAKSPPVLRPSKRGKLQLRVLVPKSKHVNSFPASTQQGQYSRVEVKSKVPQV